MPRVALSDKAFAEPVGFSSSDITWDGFTIAGAGVLGVTTCGAIGLAALAFPAQTAGGLAVASGLVGYGQLVHNNKEETISSTSEIATTTATSTTEKSQTPTTSTPSESAPADA